MQWQCLIHQLAVDCVSACWQRALSIWWRILAGSSLSKLGTTNSGIPAGSCFGWLAEWPNALCHSLSVDQILYWTTAFPDELRVILKRKYIKYALFYAIHKMYTEFSRAPANASLLFEQEKHRLKRGILLNQCWTYAVKPNVKEHILCKINDEIRTKNKEIEGWEFSAWHSEN